MLTRLQRHPFDSSKHHEGSTFYAAAPLAHRCQHAGNGAGGGAQIDVLTDSAGQPLHKGDLIEALSNEIAELTIAFARPLSRSLALQISKKLIKAIHKNIVPQARSQDAAK